MQIPSLTLIGAGRLGQTLGRLFHVNQCFRINGVYNSNPVSTQKAIDFIGAGIACNDISELPHADVVMITTPDALIPATVHALSEKARNLRGTRVVFHCSGALASTVLAPLKKHVNAIASVHPNMTFSSPAVAIDSFAGTYCAFEGDDASFHLLENVFKKIGGCVFQLPVENKPLYHAATVMSCNNLVGLLEAAIQLYGEAGIPRLTALQMMRPIVSKTIQNVFDVGTAKALTGPIARGDVQTIAAHLDAVKQPLTKNIYKSLGLQLIKLAAEKGDASEMELYEIESLLQA
jgi:predicted short-subunit dehydrogenase-like oxidoreductase (DUF2520 family)